VKNRRYRRFGNELVTRGRQRFQYGPAEERTAKERR
jgi:hypothetical protein